MTEPTPIQRLALKGGQDSQVLIAETGAGKTLAYLLPIVNQIMVDYKAQQEKFVRNIRAVVLTPTHELAVQLQDLMERVFGELQKAFLLSCQLVGGLSIQKQQRQLALQPIIIFATPGRAGELLTPEMLVDLNTIVIDEADRMLQQGQFGDMVTFCKRCTADRPQLKFVLASATLQLPQQLNERKMKLTEVDKSKKKMMQLQWAHEKWTDQEKSLLNVLYGLGFNQQKVQLFQSSPETLVNASVKQYWHFCESDAEKQQLMAYLLISFRVPTLVFCSTIQECKTFATCFQLLGLPARTLHSKQEQRQRLKSIDKLQQTDDSIVFTTDVAARGIDIPQVKLVIQYSKPNSPATHVHRIGRCARQKSDNKKFVGVAVSLIAPEDNDEYRVVQKMCQQKPEGFERLDFDFVDRLAHTMNAASLVQNAEEQISQLIQTLRKTTKIPTSIDSDDEQPEEKDAFAVAAEMMRNLKNRKEYGLGKYYQMLQKREVEPEDLRQMLDQMLYEAGQLRLALRSEIQKGLLRAGGKHHIPLSLEILQEDPRTLGLPEKANTQLVIKGANQMQKNRSAQEKANEKKAKQPQVSKEVETPKEDFIIIPNAKVVDPMAELALQPSAEKAKENFKAMQRKADMMHKKEDRVRRRTKADTGIGEMRFEKLTKQLAGEVDGDFMKLGPKEQRVKKLDKIHHKK